MCRSRLNILMFVCVAIVVRPAGAGMIVVDNLDVFVPPVGGVAVSGYDYNFSTGGFQTASIASPFVVGAGLWTIDGITIRAHEGLPTPLDSNNPDTIVLKILTDNAGSPGSTVLGSLLATTNLFQPGKYLFGPEDTIVLAEGDYWLAAFPTATGSITSSQYGWFRNGSGVDNGVAGWSIGTGWRPSRNLGATWSENASFFESLMYRIEATAVPEPSSLVLVLSAATIGWCSLRRRPK